MLVCTVLVTFLLLITEHNTMHKNEVIWKIFLTNTNVNKVMLSFYFRKIFLDFTSRITMLLSEHLYLESICWNSYVPERMHSWNCFCDPISINLWFSTVSIRKYESEGKSWDSPIQPSLSYSSTCSTLSFSYICWFPVHTYLLINHLKNVWRTALTTHVNV